MIGGNVHRCQACNHYFLDYPKFPDICGVIPSLKICTVILLIEISTVIPSCEISTVISGYAQLSHRLRYPVIPFLELYMFLCENKFVQCNDHAKTVILGNIHLN